MVLPVPPAPPLNAGVRRLQAYRALKTECAISFVGARLRLGGKSYG
jgi:hypothetical protein